MAADDKTDSSILNAIHSAVLQLQRDVGRMDGLPHQLDSVEKEVSVIRHEMQNSLLRSKGVEDQVVACKMEIEEVKAEGRARREKCSREFKSMFMALRTDLGKIEDTGVHNLMEMSGRRAQWKLAKTAGVVLISILGAVGTMLGILNSWNRAADAQKIVMRNAVAAQARLNATKNDGGTDAP